MPLSPQEQAEVERSAAEASEIDVSFTPNPENVARYLNPPADTPLPLEYSFHLLGDVRGLTVLDYGCGSGEDAVLLCARGASVIAFDISPELIEIARKRAAANGVVADFRVASAYETGLPDNSVDVVFAHAILHHLDIQAARREVMRVLKPGGILIVQEPVRDSRFLSFVRPLIPYRHQHISEFEAPLKREQLDAFCEGLRFQSARRFRLPFVPLAKAFSGRFFASVCKLDRWMLQSFPFLARYATVEVRKMSR
jgi:SAM-dependent methyltransferase